MLTWLEDVTICTVHNIPILEHGQRDMIWDFQDLRIVCGFQEFGPCFFSFLGVRCSFIWSTWSMLQGVCQKNLTELRETSSVLSLLIAQKEQISCSISGNNFPAGSTSCSARKWFSFLELFCFASFASFASYLKCRTGTIRTRTLAFEALGPRSTRPKWSLPTPNVARQKHRSHQKANANQKIPFREKEWLQRHKLTNESHGP